MRDTTLDLMEGSGGADGAGGAQPETAANCYQPRNWRLTERFLCQYRDASRQVWKDSLLLCLRSESNFFFMGEWVCVGLGPEWSLRLGLRGFIVVACFRFCQRGWPWAVGNSKSSRSPSDAGCCTHLRFARPAHHLQFSSWRTFACAAASLSARPPCQDKRVVSISGPDGTKVGTDMSIVMGVLLDPMTGTAMHCMPQDPRPMAPPPTNDLFQNMFGQTFCFCVIRVRTYLAN